MVRPRGLYSAVRPYSYIILLCSTMSWAYVVMNFQTEDWLFFVHEMTSRDFTRLMYCTVLHSLPVPRPTAMASSSYGAGLYPLYLYNVSQQHLGRVTSALRH